MFGAIVQMDHDDDALVLTFLTENENTADHMYIWLSTHFGLEKFDLLYNN